MTRRLALLPLLLMSGLLVNGAWASAQAPKRRPDDVGLRQVDGTFTVTATFEVAHTMPLAAAVLTDYDQIARFMPDVRKSVVVERQGGGAVVEQEAVARLMMFSKRIHLLLEVDQGEAVIRFRDRSGRSFKRYEGSWRLAAVNGRTTITYELTAQPAFDVPEFLLGRLLKRDAKRMIQGLRLEMARREKSRV
jgi:hypothetical protein